MGGTISGLCNSCISYYCKPVFLIFILVTNMRIINLLVSVPSIPREFMEIPRIMKQLRPDHDIELELAGNATSSATGNLSSTTTSVLAAAVSHQEFASDFRLGVQIHRGSRKPQAEPAGLARFKNLSKSKSTSHLVERKQKKGDWVDQQMVKGPKFSITLWKTRGVEDKPKPVSH
jgi:hypothetical protein